MAEHIIDEKYIEDTLKKTRSPSSETIAGILRKAKLKKGLTLEEAGYLLNGSPACMQDIFLAAGKVKKEIYGERLVFFAPLYISDYCVNDCDYCNFHARNKALQRRKLTLEEIEEQVKFLINMGHKRVLVEFGEDPEHNDIDYVVKAIEMIYSVKTDKGSIRRINVNIAATTFENYQKLKAASIGTYQLFQETYHRATYEKVHRGPKADYLRQITAYDRALEAGLDDIGLGVLFGLYDWRFEVLALIAHSQYLDKNYKVGPHTISVPRFQPAPTAQMSKTYQVSDEDFLQLIAVLRLAVPYTGMIISTRESAPIRRAAFKIGISQASAASCTTIGGYGKGHDQPQFKIQDERPLEEVVEDIVKEGYLPSFCTACYRLGRTGEHFMDISKAGNIHKFCRPNGILTFAEYLEDFADKQLYEKGRKVIEFYINQIHDQALRERTRACLDEISKGKRDVYF
ncbi:MAG: [FeFe] hydrogenase H-cluster radical SAM maturase HydG [Candidatus Omnitrophota bacterium]